MEGKYNTSIKITCHLPSGHCYNMWVLPYVMFVLLSIFHDCFLIRPQYYYYVFLLFCNRFTVLAKYYCNSAANKYIILLLYCNWCIYQSIKLFLHLKKNVWKRSYHFRCIFIDVYMMFLCFVILSSSSSSLIYLH